MAKVSLENLIDAITNIAGDKITSDEGISLLENVTDTFMGIGIVTDEALQRVKEEADARVAAVEDEWRRKYVERFNSNTDNVADAAESAVVEDDNPSEEELNPQTYNELFKEEE